MPCPPQGRDVPMQFLAPVSAGEMQEQPAVVSLCFLVVAVTGVPLPDSLMVTCDALPFSRRLEELCPSLRFFAPVAASWAGCAAHNAALLGETSVGRLAWSGGRRASFVSARVMWPQNRKIYFLCVPEEKKAHSAEGEDSKLLCWCVLPKRRQSASLTRGW